jgi:hypothetical protein
MTRHSISRLAGSIRTRSFACAGVLAVALGASLAVLANPALARADFDGDYYKFCLDGIGQTVTYCCQNSGGVISNGECVDAAVDHTAPTLPPRRRSSIGIVPVNP